MSDSCRMAAGWSTCRPPRPATFPGTFDPASMQSRPLTKLSTVQTMRTFDITPHSQQIVFDCKRDNADIASIDLPRAEPFRSVAWSQRSVSLKTEVEGDGPE